MVRIIFFLKIFKSNHHLVDLTRNRKQYSNRLITTVLIFIQIFSSVKNMHCTTFMKLFIGIGIIIFNKKNEVVHIYLKNYYTYFGFDETLHN
jgi:hypothetical protein